MTVLLLVGIGVAWWIMTPAERTRVYRSAWAFAGKAKDVALEEHRDPFHAALRERSRFVFVTPALVALNLLVFVGMFLGPAPLSAPETQLNWGASFGPRTTNGEWWRLLTALFVHGGALALIVNMAALVQPALILERLAGRLALAAVYFAAGLLTMTVSLSAHPVDVSTGASGAVYGIYGLLVVSCAWGLVRRSPVTVPLRAFKTLAPPAALFIAYNAATRGFANGPDLAGLLTGVVAGFAIASRFNEEQAPAGRVATVMGVCAVVILACVFPLRGLANVRPEIDRLVSLEDQTARSYDSAVALFQKGRINRSALAQVIDRTILPELEKAAARLQALRRVPQEQQSLVASAEEYLRLRDQSWRLRAEALQKSNMATLRQADRREQASLELFERVKAATQN